MNFTILTNAKGMIWTLSVPRRNGVFHHLFWVQVLSDPDQYTFDTLSGSIISQFINDYRTNYVKFSWISFIFLHFKDLWRNKIISSVDNQGYNISLNSTITTSLGISETSSTSRVFSFLMCKALRNSVTANTFGF